MSNQSNGVVVTYRQSTDLAVLWKNAIKQYNVHVGDRGRKIDIERGDLVTDIDNVITQVNDDGKKFHLRRSPKTTLDKVRHSIGQNLWIAQSIGNQVAAAASSAFPAAAPIWTVATYAIKACQTTSRDYDKLESLFKETGDFLKTLKILEGEVPDNAAFCERATDVIESIVVVFAIQTNYMNTNRGSTCLGKVFGLGSH